jgi:hypothetical protein
LQVLCYQFGGSSNSAEPLASEGEGVWRCLAVEKLNHVELHTEAWHTGPRSKTQTCIDEVDFVAEVHPGDDPQKGQRGNCRSNKRARIMRIVAIECGL